jgi:hypothetical protein
MNRITPTILVRLAEICTDVPFLFASPRVSSITSRIARLMSTRSFRSDAATPS